MMTTPTLLLLLLLLPHLATPIQRCYKSPCTTSTNSAVCVEQCESDDYYCQAILSTIDPPLTLLGCVQGTTSEESCDLQDSGLVRSCDCSGDLCNTVPNVTTSVENILGIDHQQPDGPAPNINGSSLVCVIYNCPTPDNCFHGYEECDSNYCSSRYTVDPDTGLLVLSRRSCWDIPFSCDTSSCHINNPISAPSNGLYLCCCNESLCNLNETFTHPTQHTLYGNDECEALNCTHSCRIVNHQPECVCPIGMILNSTNSCVDFNECIDNNGGCTGPGSRCVDTIGSFRCECDNGYVLDNDMRTCQESSGLNCVQRTCRFGNCSALVDEEACTGNHFCSVALSYHEGEQVALFQTCLSGDCGNTECVARMQTADTYFCCCNTDMCNANFTIVNETSSSVSPVATVTGSSTSDLTTPFLSSSPVESHVTPPTVIPVPDNIQLIVALVVIMFFMIVLVCIVVAVAIAIIRVRKRREAMILLPTMIYSGEESFLNEELELLNIIGRGRFARVHRAKQSGREIAVKIFSQANASWDREKEIYSTPSFGHSSILGYHGDAHLDKDATTLMVGGIRRHLRHGENYLGSDTYWLIFDYHSNGSLYDFLQQNVISMEQLCNFAESVASGLAYLHGDEHEGISKPPIAHRDLKSKNILVKSNLTCVISDFGLAAKLVPGEAKLENNGQVGTSRYMAPEVLEASVNFSDESIIRIDIYAFGLIMWEMMNRCKFSNYQVEEYHAPFYDLVSPNPTVMEMKKVVVTKKRRPEIPRGFSVSENYTRIVEMVSECWDADSEARLPANAIVIDLQTFRRNLAPVELSKESGFTSGQSLTSSLHTRAPPASPSCDSSDTLSPSDFKSAGFLPSYSHPPSNLLPADNTVTDSNNLASLYDDRPPPYEPRHPASEPRELSNEPRNPYSNQNSTTQLLSLSESTV